MKIIFRILLIFSLINPFLLSGQCTISVLDSQNITCFGGNDGYIQVSGSGGQGTFHYSLQIYNSTFNYWQQIGQSPLGNNFTYADVTFSSLNAQCYQIVLEDPAGCSDTANVCLTEPSEILSSASITSCDSFFWGGSNYYVSGQYINVFSSQLGCDSTVTLDLTINSSDTNLFSVNTCNYYTWDGVNYTASGQYSNVYTNQLGCDSIVTLNLTISSSLFTSISDTACDTYTWDGIVYDTTGQY
ncbi:SprB repeat-containing protein, partial [Flavobacteriales bacterium]|nr:SprB repeat-containing protein [Flavobacteriales bacterium]